MENENYQELANAIIIRAAKDYRILLRYRQKHPGNAEIERRINKLEREIHTPFFQKLFRFQHHGGKFLGAEIWYLTGGGL